MYVQLALLDKKSISGIGTSLPLKSVETPVANKPRDATASEPPRSTMHARVPPWRMLRRFYSTFGVSGDPSLREGYDAAYRVHLLDVKFEVDSARASGRHAKLWERLFSGCIALDWRLECGLRHRVTCTIVRYYPVIHQERLMEYK